MSPALPLRAVALFFFAAHALAQTPAPIRPIPPPGVVIPEGDRAELAAGVVGLGKKITVLRHQLKAKPELLALLPDVMIFHKAVDWALRFDEFFDGKQVGVAKKLLELGNQRALELQAGTASWNAATGLVARGYISKIDGSVQPYGLVIPSDWKPGEKSGRRLDFWAHGRGEKLSELSFIEERLTKPGEFTPPGAFVLHLYGRYCNANKFAGEVDLFEALENARTHYPIDQNKLVMRGFSMGGAAAWQFGTHFAGMFAAVAPGAGFAETREFNNVYAAGKTPPTWWEEVLYRWYDATEYAGNLANTTTVAYSGEIDKQKQAADIMLRFAEKESVTFPHIIGPQTAHKYHPEAKPKIEELVTAAIEKGRDEDSRKVNFTTHSLIYPSMSPMMIGGLEKSWARADVDAELVGKKLTATTHNVALFLFFGPNSGGSIAEAELDGQKIAMTPTVAAAFKKTDGKWASVPEDMKLDAPDAQRKRPGVCGPIDHAFMSSFVFVRPTGKPLNDKVGAWAAGELEHATGFWRKVFRGEAPVKDDTALTDADIANSNLVLWGDPSSNAVLKRILDKLPLKWTAQELALLSDQPRTDTDKHGQAAGVRDPSVSVRGQISADQTYDAAHHAPVLIFPNPLNPTKYVVLNSGPTFREEALLNNAQQVPKLPDWAIIDLRTPPDGKWPGAVVDAGFFDEQWKLPGK